MATKIKAVKCPQCGSEKHEKIDEKRFRCKSCGTEFYIEDDDINININHRYQYEEKPTSPFSSYLNIGTKVGIAALLSPIIFILLIFFWIFSGNSNNSSRRSSVNEIKKDALDFALWKSSKPNEPSWDSPWGKGRPGWHIECSAMSRRYLGDSFDIHGGGLDLIFPHHENEMAQSKCGCGGTFARYWMHNGYININGEKMSKSSGSFVLLRDILKHFEGRVIRLFVLGSHYRKPMEFSDTELNQTKSSLERIENSLKRIKELNRENLDGTNDCQELLATKKEMEAKFIEAMDEDFNTAQALGHVFELVKSVNKALDEENFSKTAIEVLDEVYSYLVMIIEEVLGVKLKLEAEVNNISADLIELILELRKDAREQKNWALSDKIRDRLLELGIKIKDGKDKTTWTM